MNLRGSIPLSKITPGKHSATFDLQLISAQYSQSATCMFGVSKQRYKTLLNSKLTASTGSNRTCDGKLHPSASPTTQLIKNCKMFIETLLSSSKSFFSEETQSFFRHSLPTNRDSGQSTLKSIKFPDVSSQSISRCPSAQVTWFFESVKKFLKNTENFCSNIYKKIQLCPSTN
jgi:hypothetical protein